MNNDLQKILDFDPLAAAEEFTGVSYKEPNSPSLDLGFALAQTHSVLKEVALASHDDTTLSNRLDRYQRIIGDLGFELVLSDPFTSRSCAETLFIYAHRDGILLNFDTFGGDHVNGGKFLYNWKPCASWVEFSAARTLSSGRMIDDETWVGDHDCREGMRHNISKLRKFGSFVTPWKKRPFMWLLHHVDTKIDGYDYAAITNERISRLPDWVREFIGPESP